MYFSQQDIDNVTMGGQILSNNPNGGAGGDPTAQCLIVPDPNEPTKPLKWKPTVDNTDESTWHNIGITYYPGNHVDYQFYDMKDVKIYTNSQQTVLENLSVGNLVSIGCIPLVSLPSDYAFFFEMPGDSSGAYVVFRNPVINNNSTNWVKASSSLTITRWHIPLFRFFSGKWYMRQKSNGLTASVPCLWFVETGTDPYAQHFHISGKSSSEEIIIPTTSDARAIESVCMVPYATGTINSFIFRKTVGTSATDGPLQVVNDATASGSVSAFPSNFSITAGSKQRMLFFKVGNDSVSTESKGFPKLKITTNVEMDVNFRYVDPNI